MGILALAADERVADVNFTEDALSVSLMDGRVISVPLVWYPRLLNATEVQRSNWHVSGSGYVALPPMGLYKQIWQQLFEHFVFHAHGDPAQHIAPEGRGVLGPLAPAQLEQMMGKLLQVMLAEQPR